MLEHPLQLNITQSELTTRVADYFDNLLAQRDAILATYNLTPETAEQFCDIHTSDEDREKILALYEKMVYVIENKQIPRELASYEQASETMGEKQFFGIEEFEQAFGFESNVYVPSIPFTVEELEQAKKMGERLILRVAEDNDGKPMSLKRMSELIKENAVYPFNEHFIAHERGFLYDGSYDAFYVEPMGVTEWRLVGSSCVMETLGQDYVDQTLYLRNHLAKIGVLDEETARECSDEQLEAMRKRVDPWKSDYIERVQKEGFGNPPYRSIEEALCDLRINKKYRRSPCEVVYDGVMSWRKCKSIDVMGTGFIDWTRSLFDASEILMVYWDEHDGFHIRSSGHMYQNKRTGTVGAVDVYTGVFVQR